MFKNITIIVLACVLAGVSYYGYNEHKEKNAILIQSENTYQRAFHDLSYQMDILHDKIGSTLAMNSRQSISPALTDVWRITSEAQTDVGQLPLALMTFSKTEEFLSDIGDFSFRTAVRDLDKEPLNEEEYTRLQKLYSQAGEIQDELRKVQSHVMSENLRWMDVERSLAARDENGDNTIIDGFQTVEKKVSGYTENPGAGQSYATAKQKTENYEHLTGKEISKKQAAALARDYAGMGKESKATVHENGKGSKFGFYSITLEDEKGKTSLNMDLTKKGGYPIWFIRDRDINEANLSLNEAEKKARAFIKEHDFDSLELYESTQYDHTGLFNFVTTVDGVRVYPDSVKVKVALDDGSVVGFSAEEYLKTNKKRKLTEPELSVEEAKKKINQKVKIMEESKALILNDLGEETLCYEFLGTVGPETYRIFINAADGSEEKVERLKEPEKVYSQLF